MTLDQTSLPPKTTAAPSVTTRGGGSFCADQRRSNLLTALDLQADCEGRAELIVRGYRLRNKSWQIQPRTPAEEIHIAHWHEKFKFENGKIIDKQTGRVASPNG